MMTDNEEQGKDKEETSSRAIVPPRTEAATGPMVLRGAKVAFASLEHRNYRLWFSSQVASLIGTWMQFTAQGFLVFELTRSPAFLGYVAFAYGAPVWLFMLFGGVVSDRVVRRTIVLITQSTMMILAFILAGLTFLGHIQPWYIVLLAFGAGAANAFEVPARQAFVIELVAREDLSNAIALNSTMFNLATAVGPAVAGVAYATLGPAWCFMINGVSFIPVIAALLMMRLEPQPPRVHTGSAVDAFKTGAKYVWSHPTMRILIALVMVTTVSGMSFATLFPAWAVKILGGDAATNGFLQSARGAGSLVGALMIASSARVKIKGKLLMIGLLVFPVILLAWSATRWLPLSLILLGGVGWATIVVFNISNILVQMHVPDELRGRVMSIYMLSFFGMFPLGALLEGAVAQAIGEPITVALGALGALGFACWLWVRVPWLKTLE